MSDTSLKATLQFSEELLCRPPEKRNDDDIQRILPWIRHKSALFKDLEDGKLFITPTSTLLLPSLVT